MITINFKLDCKSSVEIDAETIAEAVKKAFTSGIDLRGANLSGADLRNANLHGANLRGVNLHGANLRGTDLGDTDLRGANLGRANLRAADLRGADLGGTDFRIADLRGADLSNADLGDADLRDADLSGANLSGADLDFSCWPLWCGSLRAKIDKRQFCQLLYHTIRAGQSVEDEEIKEFLKNPAALTLANQFHRVNEFGRLNVEE